MAENEKKETEIKENGGSTSKRSDPNSIKLIQTVECLPGENCGPCDIVGMTSLPDGKILLSDVNNGQLRLLNTEYETVDIADVPNIWGVETVSDTKVCVTKDDKLVFYEIIGNKIRGLSDTFDLSGMGFSVATNGNHYAVICDIYIESKMGIKILDKEGNITKYVKAKKLLPCKKILKTLFGEVPKLQPFVCCDAKNDRIFVGEEDKKKVFCVSLKGKYIWDMKFDGFPNGLLSTEEYLYVATSGDNCVHVVRTDGVYDHVLLSPDDGIEWPGCITLQKKQKRLLVLNSLHVPRTINVYQLPT